MATGTPSLLTVCGLDEIEAHGSRAVTHVLSILDPETPDPDFGRYRPHVRTVLRFHDAIDAAPGVILPQADDIAAILAFGRAIAADPAGAEAHLLVHCHAGISRSTAAMSMILAQADPAQDEAAILSTVTAMRPQAWPNLRMIALADDVLSRRGRLVRAAGHVYRRRMAAQPELGDIMSRLGRSREVALGLELRTDVA